MTEPPPSPRIPSWLAVAVVVMLAMQLALTWIQGSLLQRQHQDLLALREDVQILAETLEEGLWEDEDFEESLAPAHSRQRDSRGFRRVALAQNPPPVDEDEQARKEVQASADSSKQAVTEGREVQSKLSIEEAIRKADEKAKMDEAESQWQTWLLVALGAGMAAVVVRAWLRRRG